MKSHLLCPILVCAIGCAQLAQSPTDASSSKSANPDPAWLWSTLRGTVVDHEGEPAVGATVTLYVITHTGNLLAPRSAVTEVDGHFEISAVPDYTLHLRVELEGHAAHCESLGQLRPRTEYEVRVELDRGVPLRFQTVDRHGRAMVCDGFGNRTPPFLARPDETGTFDIRVSTRGPRLADHRISFANLSPDLELLAPGEIVTNCAHPIDEDARLAFSVDPATGRIGPPTRTDWPRVVSRAHGFVSWLSPSQLQLDTNTYTAIEVRYPEGVPVVGAFLLCDGTGGYTDELGRLTIAGEDFSPTEPVEISKGAFWAEIPVGNMHGPARTVELGRGGDLEFHYEPTVPIPPILFPQIDLTGEDEYLEVQPSFFGCGFVRYENLPTGTITWHFWHDSVRQAGSVVVAADRTTIVRITVPVTPRVERTVHVCTVEGAAVSEARLTTRWGPAQTDARGTVTIEVDPDLDHDIESRGSRLSRSELTQNDLAFRVDHPEFGRQYFLYPTRPETTITLGPMAHLRISATHADGPITFVDAVHHLEFHEHLDAFVFWSGTSYRDELPDWTTHENVALPLDLTVNAGTHIVAIGGQDARVDLEPGESRSVTINLSAP